jgi:hypothetical protein
MLLPQSSVSLSVARSNLHRACALHSYLVIIIAYSLQPETPHSIQMPSCSNINQRFYIVTGPVLGSVVREVYKLLLLYPVR